MQQDVLQLVTPGPQMAGLYLAPAPGTGGNPNITYVSPVDDEGNTQVVYCKGFVTKSGKILGDPVQASASDPVIGLGPWDWMVATNGWIRQRLTERIWTNLATGKLECISGLGVRRLPRWIPYEPNGFTSFSWTMNRPETDYLIFDPPTAVTQPYPLVSQNTDAIVRCTISGPYPGKDILDPTTGKVSIPAGEDWREDYEWAGKLNASGVVIFNVMEQVFHRRGYGRYKWQSCPSDGQGGYLAPNASSMQCVLKQLPVNLVMFSLKPIQNVF